MGKVFQTTITVPVEVEYNFYPGERGGRDHPAEPDDAEIIGVKFDFSAIQKEALRSQELVEEALDHYRELTNE